MKPASPGIRGGTEYRKKLVKHLLYQLFLFYTGIYILTMIFIT